MLGLLAGILLGGLAGTALGALIARRRGVYFAMVTIAFGQIFYYIAYSWNDFTGGYDGLRGFSAAARARPLVIDIRDNGTLFYYFVLGSVRSQHGLDGAHLASPFGRTLLAIRENQRRARFLGIAVIAISGCRSRSPASLPRRRARSTRCSTISRTRCRCITACRGRSSSWW
ncbi:MAG: branched-chain amino acid ABC transporter permease [Acetobacteraceae bacterium]